MKKRPMDFFRHIRHAAVALCLSSPRVHPEYRRGGGNTSASRYNHNHDLPGTSTTSTKRAKHLQNTLRTSHIYAPPLWRFGSHRHGCTLNTGRGTNMTFRAPAPPHAPNIYGTRYVYHTYTPRRSGALALLATGAP